MLQEMRRRASVLHARRLLAKVAASIDQAIDRAVDAGGYLRWRSSLARREWRSRMWALLFGLLSSVCLIEIVLRLPFVPLPDRLGGSLFDCYSDDSYDGIYYDEPHLGIQLLRPHFSGRCFANGHRWRHRGDRWGFRNPESWEQVELVLLGDSFVYGHGVEEDETFAHRLRDELGVRVANLGVTGGCPVDYLAILRNFGVRLAPKVVVVFVFGNDLSDIVGRRSLAELQSFLNGGPAKELGVYDRESLAVEAPAVPPWSFQRVERALLTGRLYAFYRPRVQAFLDTGSARNLFGVPFVPLRAPTPSAVDPGNLGVLYEAWPPPGGTFSDPAPPELPLVSRYFRELGRAMASSARSSGAELVLSYMPMQPKNSRGRNELIVGLMKSIAESERLRFLDLTATLMDRDGAPLPGTRLPRDGHLSVEGNARVADAIAGFFREKGIHYER